MSGAPAAPGGAVVATRGRMRFAQAWIELQAEDPEAMSAFEVATRLPAGRELAGLKRLRLLELRGVLPNRPRLERLLHASIQFYNPHKERCRLRTTARDPVPLLPADAALAVAVTERGEERRHAAERWWFHETGERIEVREGVVWVLESRGACDPLHELVTLRDRRHGILCNPNSQDARVARGRAPLPWISPAAAAAASPVHPAGEDEESR